MRPSERGSLPLPVGEVGLIGRVRGQTFQFSMMDLTPHPGPLPKGEGMGPDCYKRNRNTMVTSRQAYGLPQDEVSVRVAA